MSDDVEIARVCFEAYMRTIGTATTPDWDALSPVEREAWRRVVELVVSIERRPWR